MGNNYSGMTETTDKRSVLFESAPIGYLVLNHRGIILKVNSTLCNYLDYSCTELEQNPLVGFIHHDDQRRFLDIYPGLFLNPKDKKTELKFLQRDNEIMYAEVIGNISSDFQQSDKGNVLLLAVIDVTSQHLALKQNQEKEKRFQTLFNQSAVGIAIAEPAGTFITLNKRFAEILGYEKTELEGVDFRDITHPDDLLDDQSLNSEMITGQRDTFEFEKRYIHKNGHPVWVRLYSSMVRDDCGNPLYGIVSMVDVNEQKEMQFLQSKIHQELEEHNAVLKEEYRIEDTILKRLEQAERLGSFGSFEFDIVKNTGWWSRNQYNLHGYEDKEINPGYERHLETLHPDDRHLSEAVFQNIMETDISQGSYETRIIDNQGNLRYIHTEYSVERSDNGKPLRISGVDQDVSAIRLYEMQLLESNEKYRLLSETSPNIIISHDLEGIITYANDFCCAYLGIQKKNIVGLSIDTILSESDQKERQNILAEKFMKGDHNTQKSEMIFQNAEGEYKTFEVIASPIIQLNSLTGVLVVAADITDRKANEMELIKHKENLEELVKQRTKKLEEQRDELQNFNKLFVGREFRIKELRDQVKELKNKLENR